MTGASVTTAGGGSAAAKELGFKADCFTNREARFLCGLKQERDLERLVATALEMNLARQRANPLEQGIAYHPVVSASARDLLDRPPNEAGSVLALATAKTFLDQSPSSVTLQRTFPTLDQAFGVCAAK